LPESDRHKTQRRKNIALLLVLLGLIGLLYAVALMKMSAR